MSESIPTHLNALLADYMVLYQKLRNYHWNVQGPLFFGLHEQFEKLYLDTAEKVDEIAERLTALGERPLSTLAEYLEVTRLSEDRSVPQAKDMVRKLIGDYDRINETLREVAGRAGEQGDAATVNLLEGFADGQEKTVWMLRAFVTD